MHSEMEETGNITCSNPLLNQLHHNYLWGLKSNFLDVPTDCPQRDERLGWTGDAQIFCRTACYLMNTYTFYRKWLHDVEVDQTPEGGVPHVVPNIEEGKTDGNWLLSQGPHSAAAWADVAVIAPWTLYLMYGDTKILEIQYNSMKGWIEFMREHSEDYIWNYKLQFGDWVALDAEEGSYFGATPNDLTCTAYFAYSTGLFAKIAKVLKKEEAADYEDLYAHIVKKFQETFFDAEGNMTAQTQTAHIVALYFGLTPNAYRGKDGETSDGTAGEGKRTSCDRICGNPIFLPCFEPERMCEGGIRSAFERRLPILAVSGKAGRYHYLGTLGWFETGWKYVERRYEFFQSLCLWCNRRMDVSCNGRYGSRRKCSGISACDLYTENRRQSEVCGYNLSFRIWGKSIEMASG